MTHPVQGKVEVQSSKVLENGQKSLIKQCVAVLRQGVDLIENLDDALFTRCETSEKSSVGIHFRHNLDFVANFFCGLETGKLDYNRRERNLKVETNRFFAAEKFRKAIYKLENLAPENFGKKILVRSETIENLWCESSAMRELEFLQSHTIHHQRLTKFAGTFRGFISADSTFASNLLTISAAPKTSRLSN